MSPSHNLPTLRLNKVLVTPGLTPAVGVSSNPKTSLNAALLALQARQDCSRLPSSNFVQRKTISKYVTLHPSQNRVAYVVQQETPSSQKCVCVQDTVTQQVLWMASWIDIATSLFHETDSSKWDSAANTLGDIVSLEFYDAATLYWSGMMEEARRKTAGGIQRWQGLIVQTKSRIVVLNLRQGKKQSQVWPVAATNSKRSSSVLEPSMILAHLSEESLGVAPSSNVLPLTEGWLLVGCNDGSLKCFDRKSQQAIKSIKGMGNGDWIVQIRAANTYSGIGQIGVASRRRMITVTKNGFAYLIELEILNSSLELRPPLARFSGGLSENVDPLLEPSLLTYDAHRDWVLWCQPKGSQPQQSQPVMNIWNLQALNNEFVQLDGNAGPLKPEPTLKVLPGAGTGTVMIEPSGLTAAAFGDDHEQTLVTIGVIPAAGTLVLQGANLRDPYQHRPQTMESSSLLSLRLVDLLVRDKDLDLEEWTHSVGESSGADNPFGALRIYAVKTHSLGPTSNQIVVATNVGLLVLEAALPFCAGPRHHHFGSNMGSFGKAVLSVRNSQVVYASVDSLTSNPAGVMAAKGIVDVYDSPMPTELPGEAGKRPFRASAYSIQASPSGLYTAIIWPAEFRYEIVHVGTLMEKVGKARGAATTATNAHPSVAKGNGIADFCWVGDNDIYAVLHVPGWEHMIAQGNEIEDPQIMKPRTAIKVLTTPITKVAVKGTGSALKSGSKGFTKKAFGLFGKINRKSKDEDTIDDEENSVAVSVSTVSMTSPPPQTAMSKQSSTRHVELFQLISNDNQPSTLGVSTSPASKTSLGILSIRGRHGNIPTAIFGGPVLCVASRPEGGESDEGFAQFYGRKNDGNNAESYSATGPTLPFPDICTWDDDGCLCAISIGSRVAIYLLEKSEFCMLGNVRISSPSQPLTPLTSLRFAHGVLYCCTWNSVHCVMLGDLMGGISLLDSYLLAATDRSSVMGKLDQAKPTNPLTPDPALLPLVQPTVLGYQSGSLILSTLRGVYALSLEHPIMRLGTLLASGQIERASQWISAFDRNSHEGLAYFLERRGHAALALRHLNGLSLETVIDLCMRYDEVDRLEDIAETQGVRGLRKVDMGRGVLASIFGPESGVGSITVSVGAYLLAHGRIETVRQLASECLRLDEQGKKDALFLGTLLMQINETDANRLIQRAVDSPFQDDWPMGSLVRNLISKKAGSHP
ncbi:hypothetical protein FisN_25Lh204 [Fistulifera solaris]|uniref:Uncharacterized protein n=1 Tax=Fistulifera solaris TaxID=1519565 RepID=A0A1Z5KRK7_FISSO|nr:hypothetical protein FisN_25Lh204 [Fistulifera solaris]|eukprot:GAX28742.1 hypothetical protein FisN_25Lh204 [Fistulifera solaris]